MRRPSLPLLLCAAAVSLLQGCAVVEFAKHALDPGIPGPKPLRPEAAAELSEAQIEQRLDFVTQRLEDNRTHAAWWYYGFLAVNAGGMVAGAATAPFEDDTDDKAYDIINASLGLIGVVYMLADPLPGRSGADPVREMPSATHDDRAAQLAEAEEILYRAAGRARQRTGWVLHTGNVVLNAAGASILLARESYGNAGLLFGVNTAVGAAQILLTPWAPQTSWEEYQQFVARGGAPVEPEPRLSIAPLPTGQGLALQLEF